MTAPTADNTKARPTVALLGTGIMGAGMARSLLRAGLPVRVWNRTREKAEALVADGAYGAASPAEAVDGADVVLTMLNDGPRVLAVMREAADALAAGTVWAQSATVGDAATAELAGFARERSLTFVDAPVLGSRQPAEQGELLVLAAGPASARDVLAPVFDAVGRRTLWVGDDGATAAASRLKLVLNGWVSALNHAAAEAMSLARGLDVDPQAFLDAVAGGVLDNGYLRVKAAAILADDFSPSFSVTNALKDGRLIVEAGERAGVRLDLAQAGVARFERVERDGRGGDDMAASYFASFD
ncbi:NAD(P)-dependent oxidoreductase [Streptomyces sp. NBC_01619]|uniref:NAD(P)-dependent oxidoreductase n=1 Tax=Streptomyces pratisoli TaxID=3139917 RepID=A0ACC6QA68_9ACTN|nr:MULTISPECIES: NAD(P)-dependent oxidoreductase [unclassified Streptomyces]MCX4510963.1 NAD(P)-dependent oxidoreductase [Streptomyces sp. NBC_01619]